MVLKNELFSMSRKEVSKKEKRYWLLKSEENCYSIDDFKKDRVASWTEVRNFQARNFIRDQMQKGDGVLFYHSSTLEPAVVGIGRVGSDAYSDPTAFDKKSDYFDSKSKKDAPTWFARDIIFVKKLKNPINLGFIKSHNNLKNMVVAQKGSRLSVQPVLEKHFHFFITK